MKYLKDDVRKSVIDKTTLIEVDTDNVELLEHVLNRKLSTPINCKYYGNGEVKNNPLIIKLSEIKN